MVLSFSTRAFVLAGATLLLAACGGPDHADDAATTVDSLATDTTTDGNQLINVGGKLFSIPSPVQTAFAIRSSGSAYRKDLPLALDKFDQLTGKVAESAALGMYGADLAYVTVHKDGQRSLATLQVIEKLSNKLGVSNAFDRSMVERFKNNLSSEDSLLRFSGTAFRAADQYLKNNDRGDVSALVLTGGWVESLYLIVSDPTAMKNQALVDRIGDQKATLDGVVELVAASDLDQSAAPLLKALRELQGDFAGIERTYSFEPPITEAGTKVTFINSRSTVTIPAEKLAAIAAKVTAIRSMIIA